MKYINLSVPITADMPVYPGDPKTKIIQAGELQKDGFEVHILSMLNHSGTHIDAPSHMIEGGKSLDKFPLEAFVGRGVYIKIEEATFDLDSLKQSDIQKDDIVLFHTGMSDHANKSTYFEEYPAIPQNVAEYLVEKQVKMVGVDTYSVDHEQFIAHKILLQHDILILENLTSLEALADKQFMIYAFPLNLSLDGSPVRAVAEIA